LIGIEGRRLQMINLSSAMGGQFAFSVAEMTAEIERMGPNPLKAPELKEPADQADRGTHRN